MAGPRVYDRLYVGGQWIEPVGRGTLDVIDSATETRFATIPAAEPADVDRAVAAARAAFATWSEASPSARGIFLRQVAEGLDARRDELADVIAHEVGMPKHISVTSQVGGGISGFAAAAELATTFP